VRRRPYRVILLDEVEKAHPEVFNTLLQILDDGRLTDGHGRTVDFKNSVIIMTSNTGAESIRQGADLGFGTQKGEGEGGQQSYQRMKGKVMEEVKKTFRPEFINRIDEIIVFHELTKTQLGSIVDLLVKDLQQRLSERGLMIELTEDAKFWLVKEGYDPAYGARPLRRAIERYVENPLSSKLLEGEFSEGDKIIVGLRDDKLIFSTGRAAKAGARIGNAS